MKKIGIIGGAGPLASALLYKSIVRECYLEKKKIPEILLLNFPFTRCLTGVEESKNLKIVLEEISYCIKTLERHGVDVGVLACNTLHLFLKMLPKPIFPFKALPKLVLSVAKENKVKSLLLLGTQNSCKLQLYQDSSINIVYPSKEDQCVIDNIIDQVLEGVVCMEDSLLTHLTHTSPLQKIYLTQKRQFDLPLLKVCI